MLSALAVATLSLGASAAEVSDRLDVGLAPHGALSVHDINGNVTVTTGATFAVRYRKHGSTDLAAVRVLGNQDGRETSVCVRYPGDSGTECGENVSTHNVSSHTESNVTVDFEIVVPAGTDVDVTTVNGKLDVHSAGRVRAKNVNGKIVVDAADVDEVSTVNGSIDVTVRDAQARGGIAIKTVNGSIALRLPTANARVDAKILNGDIDAFGLPVSRPQFGPGASVSGDVGSGGRRLDLKALNGSIRVSKI